jgi:WD40 repeat protein/DNA-binding SARP family transcriptional activator
MLQIRLLGQFDLRLDGKRVALPSRAAQSLFAYLALTAGTAHRREKLAGTLWPDFSDEIARKNLRHELWRIRKAISAQGSTTSDYLLANELTLTFNPQADYWLDVAVLQRPELDSRSLTSNLSVYQGELLPGFYDDWILLERERLQSIFESKMEQLVETLVDAERWTAIQEQCERWLAFGNTPEPAYRALMISYSARGDISKVSATYQRCVDDLRDQFGVEPSAETHSLYNGLLKGSRSPRRLEHPQPSGTVTFLFTDIEGSTLLLDKLGEGYATVLADHHQILRTAVRKWHGREVDTQGDAFFVTFTRALDAIQCAAEAQRALASHVWQHDEPLRVRMGLHTGEPLIATTGYVGMDVHRAARIGDAGHGGQVLLSQTTRDLVSQELPPGITIRDLGEHRLKDLKYPTPIYQLVIDGLPAEFPPLKTKFTGSEAPTPGEPPFKGLQYFDENDADLFFGREQLTSKLVKRLHDTRFLSVIIGASGSGKSSLVRAGLIPALKKGLTLLDGTKPPEGSDDWQVYVITPTAHPLEALAGELTRDSESITATATLLDDLARDPRSLSLFLARRRSGSYTLLVVDQFEELFTLCRDEFEREAFIDNLLTALTPTPLPIGEGRRGEGRVTLILTLRADFYAHLAQYPELRDLVAQQQEYIGPMSAEELRRAIEEPARRGHWEFEPGLVDLILRDVGDEPGALPLLSHALLETWKRRAGHTLTLKGYADAGGVHGAIAHTAESVYQNLSPDEQAITRDIFVRLTELGEGTEDTRRRASFEELMSHTENVEDVRSVLNKLADARLVTLGEDTADVAHEALIREWPTLREWLNEDREGLRLHRHLTEAAYEWELLGRDPGALYRGAHLAQANEWCASNPQALNAQEKLFLEESNLQARREEQEREAQRERELAAAKELAEAQRQSASRLRIRNRIITTVGTITLVLAILAGSFGLQSNQNALRAENEKALATSRELALAANSNLNTDPELSILLSLQALSAARTSEAESALHSAVQASRVHLTLQEAGGWTVEYSPDGTRLATSSGEGDQAMVKIWDAATGKELLSFAVPDVGEIRFNADGTRLAIVSAETAGIWDTATGEQLLSLSGHPKWIQTLTFSPDESLLATASEDHTAKVWDLETGEELLTLSGHTDIVNAVEFSPDGTHLATSSWGNMTKIWDLATGQEVLTIPAGLPSYTPDGKQILAYGPDGSIIVWDALTGQELSNSSGPPGFGIGILTPDRQKIIHGTLTGKVIVWDIAAEQELFSFPAHVSSITDMALHPDGIHLATASADGTVKVWDISPQGSREWLTLSGLTGIAPKVAYSPDGMRLATSGPDNTVIFWDAATGKVLVTLTGHTDTVWGLVFSPDGSRLAAGSLDQTARVWDTTTGKELLTLSQSGHGDGVIGGLFSGIMAVTFSPDGKKLATAGSGGTAIIWDATSGQPLLTLTNQEIGFTNLAFSPDGKQLLTGTENILTEEIAILWDSATGKELLRFTMPTRVWGLAFSPDGEKLVLSGSGGAAKMWDARTGEFLFSLAGHSDSIADFVFSKDGSRLASASWDGTARVWDASSGKEQLTLHGHAGPVIGVAFSPDGTRLATSSSDGTARIYLLNLDELIALAKLRLTRSLTSEECQRYVHMDQCPSEP